MEINVGKQNDRKQHLSRPIYPCVPEYVVELCWDMLWNCAGICCGTVLEYVSGRRRWGKCDVKNGAKISGDRAAG